MTSPGNRYRANCIGTLSFPIMCKLNIHVYVEICLSVAGKAELITLKIS